MEDVLNATTAEVLIIFLSARNTKRRRNRYQEKYQDIKNRMVSKLHRFADNNHINISKAFFDKEDNKDSSTPQLTEEDIN